ncbi:Ubiquinone/menaquinone biosynthesis C-methyltransferase UbiE [Labrenzia sp. THAF82]|uniref:class I SAM-dependent methyltransferase n=1 Tax=Labrenzia sp. THAF82 TaxID=2587861 RepID=UPI0012A9CBB9|nr:class I SAM-dependent methyltransferase [Labrenzia sp. THAF82]QFT31096.1 Ubiquinone/menaquinone biosynthesis C-methyltransferase UbiE [Labrenzia sp. THAF82]
MTLAERYEKGADRWALTLERLGFPAAYRFLFSKLGLTVHDKDVCDVGTGCGDFAAALFEVSGQARSLTLVDPSSTMLQKACRRLRLAGRQLRSLPVRLDELTSDKTYDLILGAHVLEHLEDPEHGLRHLLELLKPGGRLVLSVSKPHICQWFIWLRWRHRWYHEDDVCDLLRRAGFQSIEVHRFPNGVPSRCSHAYSACRVANQDPFLGQILES